MRNGIIKYSKNLICIIMVLLMCIPLCNESYAAEGYDSVASKGETAKAISIGKYGMVPVYGRDVKDGTYDIDCESSSTFFHIEEARLTAKDGKLSAVMTLSSTSYKFIFPGSAEEAAKAPLEDYIAPKNRDGMSSFRIEVDALDKGIPCAAYSVRKKKWYDRMILFDASSLPKGALKIALPDYDLIEDAIELYDETNGTDSLSAAEDPGSPDTSGGSGATGTSGAPGASKSAAESARESASSGDPGSSAAGSGSSVGSGSSAAGSGEGSFDEGTLSVEPVDIDMKDGEYSIQVHMTGGSGRASVTSPTWLIVKDGKAYARLLWSSSYYDYMIINGRKFMNETTDGGSSTFTVPITVMDGRMPVIADTTAMGDPVEIEYTLTFYRDSVAGKNQIPQEAAINVLLIALIIIVAGGILNFIVKRKRKA